MRLVVYNARHFSIQSEAIVRVKRHQVQSVDQWIVRTLRNWFCHKNVYLIKKTVLLWQRHTKRFSRRIFYVILTSILPSWLEYDWLLNKINADVNIRRDFFAVSDNLHWFQAFNSCHGFRDDGGFSRKNRLCRIF